MNTHLTLKHIESLAAKSAKARDESYALHSRRITLESRRARVIAYMNSKGIAESKRGNMLGPAGLDPQLAARLQKLIARIRLSIGINCREIRWNKLDISPRVLTDFCNRDSAITLIFV